MLATSLGLKLVSSAKVSVRFGVRLRLRVRFRVSACERKRERKRWSENTSVCVLIHVKSTQS